MPPAPVRVPTQRQFAPIVTSVTNDKGVHEMIPGAMHRSPGISLIAEENPGKLQLGDRLMKWAVRPVIVSNGDPFPQMRSVGSHSPSGREMHLIIYR